MTDTFTHGMGNWENKDNESMSNYTRWQAELIEPFLGKRVLEVGAGEGRFAQVMRAGHTYDRYVAVEPSPILFKSFKENCPDIEAHNSVVETLDDRYRGDFDTILLIHVLEHIKDDAQFLKTLREFLKPGGRLIVMVPAFNALFSELDRKIGHFRRYTKGSLATLGHNAGFHIQVNRYDNLIGVPGWFWFCKVLKGHFQEQNKKQELLSRFDFFDKYVLPVFSRIEKTIPPPIGLNLTTILKKPF